MINVKIVPKYKPPKAERVRRKKLTFANAMILMCVSMGIYITVSIITDYKRLGVPVPGDVVNALFFFWGGELLIIALRQVFGSDITKKKYTEDVTYESQI